MVMTTSDKAMMQCFTWLQASLISIMIWSSALPSDQESTLFSYSHINYYLPVPLKLATKSTLTLKKR